jgi:DNA adenine methylase
MTNTGRLTLPLKTHCGKSYLARRIVALMPPHLHYCEPFAGGLAVVLAHDPNGVSEAVSDIDGRLMNFWDVIGDEAAFARFYRRVSCLPLAETAWERAKAHQYGEDSVSDAVAFFVCCRQSLAGRMKCFTPLTKTRTRRGMNGNVSEWLGAVDGLPAVHDRLRQVAIRNKSFRVFIPSQDTPETLFYCDPPYLPETRTARDVYHHEMSETDHRELLDLLRSVQGKVMLSGYPSKLYDETLQSWNRQVFDMPNHAAGGRAKRRQTEALWCNF